VDDGHIPSGAMPGLPWNQGQAVGPLTIVSAEALWLFDSWCFRSDKSAMDQVIEPSMTLYSPCIIIIIIINLRQKAAGITYYTLSINSVEPFSKVTQALTLFGEVVVEICPYITSRQ